jgi:peptide/nickel transport system permease protein
VTLQTGSAILVESFLSFLGLGDPTLPSWGLLLQQAQIYLRSAWWMATFPGVALSATILGLNLLNDSVEGRFVARRDR